MNPFREGTTMTSLIRITLTALYLSALLAPIGAPRSARGQAQPVSDDPLPSWKDRPVKKAILDYVARLTAKDGPDYIPPEDRIATFDNDGTLWCEKPTVELVFTEGRLKTLAAADPTMKAKQPFKAALEGDLEFLHKAGMKAVLEIVAATHGNVAQDQFEQEAAAFF